MSLGYSDPMVKRRLCLSVLIALVVALSSCGRADVKKGSGQIVAKVNATRFRCIRSITRSRAATISRLARLSRRLPRRSSESSIRSCWCRRRSRTSSIAIRKSCRRSRTRNGKILAQAYLERAAAGSLTESREEISKFYQENPALFERRRIYRVHELVVFVPRETLDALKAATAGAKSLQDVAGWPQIPEAGVPGRDFQPPRGTDPAEYPVSSVRDARGADRRDSDLTRASVVQLLQAQEASLSEQQATPIIERYLRSRKQFAVARAEVKRLRERARIEYVGEFEAARAQPASSSATRAQRR